MMNSPPFARRMPPPCAREVWHEDDRFDRRSAARAAAHRSAPARRQADVEKARRAIRQGRLAGVALPRRARRARGGGARPSPHRAPSRRSASAGRQDTRDLRLAGRPDGQQGAGDGARRWRQLARKGANLLLFGPPGAGKSHLAAAIGLALVENGWRVLFMRAGELVQRLQIARRELGLESAIAKLDKYHLLILYDIAYVSQDQAETSELLELIA